MSIVIVHSLAPKSLFLDDAPRQHAMSMIQNFHIILDTVITTIVVSVTTLATILISAPAPNNDELKLLLVPLIGALITSGGMIMLNPRPETRRIVMGRASISLLMASCGPQLCSLWFTSTATFFSHPVVALAAGGVLAMFIYAITYPFCAGLYRRSEQMSSIALDRAQGALLGSMRTAVSDVVDNKIDEATAKAAHLAKENAKEVLATAIPVAAQLIKTAAEVAGKQTEKLNP